MTGQSVIAHSTIESFWSAPRVTQLRELFDKGLSNNQIAAEMDIHSRNVIIGKLHRLGLTREVVAGASARGHHTAKRIKEARPKGNVGSVAYAVIHGIKAQQARAAEPEKSVPEPKPVEIISGRVSLFSARANQCRWPAADDGSATMVCGASALDGSWCVYHANRAFVPNAPRRGLGR
jgi:GcrA cell cycle regulator